MKKRDREGRKERRKGGREGKREGRRKGREPERLLRESDDSETEESRGQPTLLGRKTWLFFIFKGKGGQVHSWGRQTSSPLPDLLE